jgi:hypothetical protein
MSSEQVRELKSAFLEQLASKGSDGEYIVCTNVFHYKHFCSHSPQRPGKGEKR